MISLEKAVLVNAPGTKSKITRAEVWHGLVLKADNALPFVPSITYCKVLERVSPTQFIREIDFKGDRMKERVTLEHEQSVTFERIAGNVLGTIKNYIDEDKNGELMLRFAFQLEPQGMAPGSPAEKEYGQTMEKAYTGAVDATLGAIKKLHDETSEAARKAPAWLTQYYADVDGMKMDAFLAHHTPDARVAFGNNPHANGHEQIGGAIGGLWSAIDGLRHRFVNVWETDKGAVLEASITYFRKDGKSVTVPCVSILERKGDKVSDLRVHIDLAPVFA